MGAFNVNFRVARKHFLVETKDKAEKGKAAPNDYTILDGKDNTNYTILDGKDYTILDGKEWNIKDYSIDGKGENKGGKSDTNNPYPFPGFNIVFGRKKKIIANAFFSSPKNTVLNHFYRTQPLVPPSPLYWPILLKSF